jgi:ABC-type Fe3+-siderophore transport system permease subunit
LLLSIGLAVVAAGLFWLRLAGAVPPQQLWAALWSPAPDDLRQLFVHHSLLPRLALGLLCGGALGLAGTLFQQVLRNPLAEPGTLGVFAGAKLALAAVTLWSPDLFMFGFEAVALAGGGAAMLLVLLLAWRQRFDPLALILSGLVITIYLGGINAMLALFHQEALRDLFVWQAGSLNQNNWLAVEALLPPLAVAAVLAALLVRPLELMALQDDVARAMGLKLPLMRLAALGVAVLFSALVVAHIGVVGFIGLAGPLLARLGGARRLRSRLVWGGILGALLLSVADQAVQALGSTFDLPTGTLTSLLGAGLLLWMLPRLRAGHDPRARNEIAPGRLMRPWLIILCALPLLALAVWVALSFARVPQGWHWSSLAELPAYWPWRGARVGGAFAAGALFGIAGTLLQRLTGNAMASPELLGISSGAALGLIAVLFAATQPGPPLALAAATTGALAVLMLMLWLGRRSTLSPEHVLLTGVALSTLVSALTATLLATGDPRMIVVLNWMAGSTYRVTAQEAAIACMMAAMLIAISPLMMRWLTILPLGNTASRSVGVPLAASRLAVLLATAAATATGTLIVGPLSFVGLMAPHAVRLIGFRQALPQLCAAAILGALLMVLADLAGRIVAFPWQVPAGLVATFLGGSYFIALMWTRR